MANVAKSIMVGYRIVPRNNLTNDPDGLHPGVGHHLPVRRDRLAVHLVRPASVVPAQGSFFALPLEQFINMLRTREVILKSADALFYILDSRSKRFPVVEGVEASQLLLVPLHQVGQGVEEPSRNEKKIKNQKMILPRPLASILLQLDPGRKAALAAETARSTSALRFGEDVELVFIYLLFY